MIADDIIRVDLLHLFDDAGDPKQEFVSTDVVSRNVAVAAWAYRCRRRRAGLEVGLFLVSDCSLFVPDAGVRTGLIAILLQAYQLTSSMKVRFKGPRPGTSATTETGFEPVIPEALREYARKLGVTLSRRQEILEEEGRNLFIRMNLSPDEAAAIDALGLDPFIVALQQQRGAWTPLELHAVLHFCTRPRLIMTGMLIDEVDNLGYLFESQRVLMRNVLAAQLAKNLLGIYLEKRYGPDDELITSIDLAMTHHDRFRVLPSLAFTLESHYGDSIEINSGEDVVLLPYPRESEEYEADLPGWLHSVSEYFENERVIVVITDDIIRGSDSILEALQIFCQGPNRVVLRLTRSAGELDLEFHRKLQRANDLNVGGDEQPDH